jgi:hypothetical protein
MLCFVHVPKTGGTTVNAILRQSLGHHFTEIQPWVDMRRLVSPADLRLLKCWAPWIRHISSHWVRANCGLERFEPNIRYITFLREPLLRYLSDYNHLRFRNFRVASYCEYVNNPAWSNKQTKYIAGTADLESAKMLLDQSFCFVGLLDRMDESLVMMNRILKDLNLDIRYGAPRNPTRRDQREEPESWSELEAKTIENNALDWELYEYACREIFPRQQQAYEGDLARDLERFESEKFATVSTGPLFFLARLHYRLALLYYRKHAKRRRPIDNGSMHDEFDFFGDHVF